MNERQNDSRNRKKQSGDAQTMWNDLQIEQWADDDHMRKTRVQNDQFWDHLHDNVDDYVKRKGKKKGLEKN